jgi:hypothetical protein
MTPLPLPVRLAAGLVATAVEQVRDLPKHVIEFPVTAVSQALQVSMRVQQRVTELAIKGDRALGALRPVEEQPSWATFDEDLPTNGHPAAGAVSTVTELRPAPRPPRRTPAEPSAPVAPSAPVEPDRPVEQSAPVEQDGPAEQQGPAEPSAPVEAAAEAPAQPASGNPARAVELIASAPVDQPAAEPTAGPGALPGYATMSIAQLRGKLRSLSPDELRALLAWERTHDDRPAYVTMLSNRIATVSEG